MTATYMDDTATYSITVAGAAQAQEPECYVSTCPKVALWQVVFEFPCDHTPAQVCEEHARGFRRGGHLSWMCERHEPEHWNGKITSIERIPR